jgi:hypothetical protein
MSTNLAYALPERTPRTLGDPRLENPRRIEIVSSREQRRARPRLAYALIAIGGLLGIFLAQLLLSIALSNGAYQISSLLGEKRDLVRVEGSLSEQLGVAASTQNLASNAQKLGMVASSTPAYLGLDGQVIGAAVAADGKTASSGLTANSLLGGAPLVGVATVTEEQPTAAAVSGEGATGVVTETDTAEASAPAVASTTESVPSTAGALPSPVTH